MPGAPFGSTKSASSHTHHPTGHVAITDFFTELKALVWRGAVAKHQLG